MRSRRPLPAGWTFLDPDVQTAAWARFADKFGELHPGLHADNWPAIVEPTPSVTFDLRPDAKKAPTMWAAHFDAVNAEAARCLLEVADPPRVGRAGLATPRIPTRPGRTHDCARRHVACAVPVYPNGDYYTFALPDFTEGTFGDLWEQSLCVFGPRLVDTLAVTLSTWLPRLRVDGQPV